MLFSLLAAVAALLLGAYAYLANPNRAASLATGLIESSFNVTAQLDGARFGLDGTINLRGLRLDVLDMPEAGSRLMDVDHVAIEHNAWSLLLGRFHPTKVTLKGPILHITEEPQHKRFNYQLLIKKHDDDTEMVLPAVVVRNGVIRSGEVVAGRYTPFGELGIDGRLFSTGSGPRSYTFNLERTKNPGGDGPLLSGRFNLDNGSVTARLERFSIDSPQRNLLPRALRAWWDQYEPSGSLLTVTFEYNPDPSVGLKALVELKSGALSLPQTEPPTHLRSVTGRIAIENDLIRPDLTCVVQHQYPRFTADCEVSGWIRGLEKDAPYDLSLRTKGRVPAGEARTSETVPWEQLPRVSKIVQWIFHRFAPKGRFGATLQLAHGSEGSPPTVRGTVNLAGEGQFLLFPYPLRDVEAQLHLTDEGIEIVNLEGTGAGDSSVQLGGKVYPLSKNPAVEVLVQGRHVPIDRNLFSALRVKRPQVVPAIDMFMDREAYQDLQTRLKEQLAADEKRQHAAAEAADPAALKRADEAIRRQRILLDRLARFEPGGTVAALSADLTRPPGPGRQVTVKTELDMAGVGIVFRYWPYPVRATKGRLIISPDKVVADGIEGHGLDEQVILSINGTVSRSSKGWAEAVPDLRVTARQMPLDDLLIATVPQPQDRIIRSLGLSGLASAEAHVFRNESGQIDFTIKTKIHDGRARPNDGRYVIDRLSGQLTVGPKRIEIDSIKGYGPGNSDPDSGPGGEMELSGRATWDQQGTSFELHMIGSGLRFDDPLVDLMPRGSELSRKVAAMVAKYRPRGVFDADLRCTSGDGGEADYALHLVPKRIGFDLKGHAIDVHDIAGRLNVTPQRLEMESFSGSWGGGRFKVSGHAQLVEPYEKRIQFSAEAEALDATARAVLPDAVIRTLDTLRLAAPYRISDGELHLRPLATTGMRSRFEGSVHLAGASGLVGVPVSELTGDLRIGVHQTADADWPVVSLTLQADRLRVNRRLISPLTARIVTDAKKHDRLLLRELQGTCYGGSLAGSGWVDLAASVYHLRLTLHDAALESIVNPVSSETEAVAPQDRRSSTGRLAAALAVEGSVGDTSDRRGRGELRIRNAVMYDVPLTLGLVHVVNLSLPTSSAFDRADIAYEVDAELVRFEQLRFHAPSVEMVGSGTMHYDTRQLDLNLYARSPEGIPFTPVSELINKFKDELVSVHVTGTLDNPHVQVQSLRGVRRSWQRIFGQPDVDGEDAKEPEG